MIFLCKIDLVIIKRKLFEEIEKYVESKQTIVVTGMRRVGKTTLLNYFYERITSDNKIFLDLEDPLNQAIFAKKSYNEIKTALQIQGIDFSKKAYLFLDEIQLAKNIPSVVKYFYDHYSIKFFLTGSASFYLKNLFSESLAGRKYLFELYPLDFEEFIWFRGLNYKLPTLEEEVSETTYLIFAPLVEEYLKWGAMPEVVLLENPNEKQIALRDIFSSYFQKEVQLLSDFRKNEIMRNLIFLLAKRVGQKLDIQRISQELGVVRHTIYEYLEFLAGTYFIFLLPALGKVDVAQRKQKKAYFIDCGFFCFLEPLSSGSIFENAVYLQLRNLGEIFYFQNNKGEIDFVVNSSSEGKLAFEVKEHATISDIKKVKRLCAKISIPKSFVVSLNFTNQKDVKYLFQLLK